MTYRKKRLLLIQGALLFAALLLFYIFYYEGKKNQAAIETDRVVLKKQLKRKFLTILKMFNIKGSTLMEIDTFLSLKSLHSTMRVQN